MPSFEQDDPRPRRRTGRRGATSTVASAIVASALVLGARLDDAKAQETAAGFAVERLYRSAPGGGWLVMDDLSMHGKLGGALSLTTGYARDPLHPTVGAERVRVVSHQAFVGFAAALTYDRFRVYFDIDAPLAIKGDRGEVGKYHFAGPDVDVASNPDTLTDPRIGFDARLFGEADGAFRLGVGAQLIFPNGVRAEYTSDATYRGMGRILAAGDVGRFAYAAHLGVHLRPLDDSAVPGSPRGHELLFGVAVGPKLAIGKDVALVVGPELFGESALRSFFKSTTTGVEALLTGRIEQTSDDASKLRLKVGVGAGLHPEFGAPAWRGVVSLELSDRGR